MEYVECNMPPNAANVCDRNIECVKTPQGTRWCTGPKTKKCYSYDNFNKVWEHVYDLKTARAYAGSVSMPNGMIYIAGGAGMSDILRSVEIFEFIR